MTTADAVARIALGSVSGNASASGNAGDAQQNAAAPASSPPLGFAVKPPVTGPLSEDGTEAPRRPGVAASAAFVPAGLCFVAGRAPSRETLFPAQSLCAAVWSPLTSGRG